MDIMTKLKENLNKLKKPTNDFKEIIEKKTFKSSRDKIEFVKRFKKMIVPNFRIEKIRKQRNHLIIIELMSKIQNKLIINRLNSELTKKINLNDLVFVVLKQFKNSVDIMSNKFVKQFYQDLINTYFNGKNNTNIDCKYLVQLFKSKEEQEKNQEFFELFQKDLNYLEQNKKQCENVEEKIHSLKFLILESILKEKDLERSVNRLLLNHEQSKYGYFYKVNQTEENTYDTTEYGKLLENFSKEAINFYSILNKRNLDKHAYHDIRNFNFKINSNEKIKKNTTIQNGNKKMNKNIRDYYENENSNKVDNVALKINNLCDEDKQTTDTSKNSNNLRQNVNNHIYDNNGICVFPGDKDTDKDADADTDADEHCNQLHNANGGLPFINVAKKELGLNNAHIYYENGNAQGEEDIYRCHLKRGIQDIPNCNNNNRGENKHLCDEKDTTEEKENIKDKANVKDKANISSSSPLNKCSKDSITKRINNESYKKGTKYKDKNNNKKRNELECGSGEYENKLESDDIIRFICEQKKNFFVNEKQEKINNEIFYKVFEQYPYIFFKKTLKNYNSLLNENQEETDLAWLTVLKKNNKRSILPPSRDTFRDGTHFANCRATEHTLKFFLSLLSLLTKKEIDKNLKDYLKKNIQFLNTELFSMKLNLDKKRLILEKKLDRFNFQENSEFSFYNPLKMNIRMMNLIGRGGFAEVWEVFDSINLEMYAAKIHKIEPTMDNQIKNKIIQRAENEINIHIHCHRHIFIVKLEFFFVFGSATNLLVGMELCEIDLDKYIKYHGPINELLALCWTKQVLLGLLYMKKLPTGMVHHCDLKPANLLIKDGVIKISDFGLAKLILPNTCQFYNGGGTLYYQPPECLKNKKKLIITDKIDIWSLGCILYEMLFCERPFQFSYLEKCSKDLLINKIKKGVTYPKINQPISQITLDYIQFLLTFDYELRPSIEEALNYPIFENFNIS
uniref:Protein kinase domain-containing protein n=1 Tax=Piliocolobus tephrosceles TaxID=591936 RepID=A0A8C9G9F3_9PRIM